MQRQKNDNEVMCFNCLKFFDKFLTRTISVGITNSVACVDCFIKIERKKEMFKRIDDTIKRNMSKKTSYEIPGKGRHYTSGIMNESTQRHYATF